jgi:hypothetical protein
MGVHVSKILSLSLRPRTLSTLFGQDATVAAIRKQVEKRPPQTWMFHGGTGTGKTTLARILSVAYQCQHMKVWGDPCDECWKQRNEFAIHEINASSVNGIDDLEKVVGLSKFKPTYEGGKRVIILDEAQKISNAAQNMLLTPFESPPISTIWIVCTTEPGKILPTLRRRLTTYQLKSLGISAAEKFLTQCAAKAGITRALPPLFEQCHLMGISAPAILLQALEKYAAGSSATEATTGTDASGVDSLRICKALTSGNWKALSENLKDVSADEVRYVRASTAGWLKGVLVREAGTGGQERAATSLLELCAMPLDEAIILNWLWGALNKICRRYAPR